MSYILETERLLICKATIEDAPFYFELMNDSSWIENIGDRGITNLKDAENYIVNKFQKHYQDYGFGFYTVKLKTDLTNIGMSGLVKRDFLEHVDIGYGFLPQYTGKGYAFEATKAVFDYGKNTLNINPIIAIVNGTNTASQKLLNKLGLTFEKWVQLPEEDKKIQYFS